MNPDDPSFQNNQDELLKQQKMMPPTHDSSFQEKEEEITKKEYENYVEGLLPIDLESANTFEEIKDEELKIHSEIRFEKSNGMQDALQYMKQNKESWVTYLFLTGGLLTLVIGHLFLGSIIIGLTAGYHFSYEIVFYLRNLNHLFEGHEHLRFLVLTAVILALFFSIPGIFLGAVVAAVFKHVIYDKSE